MSSPSFFLPTFSPLIFPTHLFLLFKWLVQPLPPQEKVSENFLQNTAPLLKHSNGLKRACPKVFTSIKNDTKFPFRNIPSGRCRLKTNKQKGLQIIYCFLTLKNVLQHTRLTHRYCHFMEHCRNQPNIWYHNNKVTSITKTGLLWNLSPFYDKIIILAVWIHSRFLAHAPTNTGSQREISLADSSGELFSCALRSYEVRHLVQQFLNMRNYKTYTRLQF